MTTYKDVVTSSEILTGRVKWFNNKRGLGFITVTDGIKSGMDVFAHHSSIMVSSPQYKYLVQGEYVEFVLTPTPDGKYEFQSTNIRGINSGKLMCETRYETSQSKVEYASTEKSLKSPTQPQTQEPQKVSKKSTPKQPVRAQGEGPRSEDNAGWSVIEKTKPKRQRAPKQSTAN